MENKTLAITKIILLSFIALLLTIILIILLVNPKKSWNFLKISSKSELVYEKKIEDNIKEIKVTTKSADIEIQRSNNPYLEVKYYGEKNDKDLSLTTNNQILNINEDTSYFCIGICNYAEHKILISVPENNDYELNIQTASGDISIDEIKSTKMTIKSISGDINISNAEFAKVESTSGDIEINSASKLTAKTISGELVLHHIKNYCNIKTTSGDIEIILLELTENSSITTISGDVDINKNIGSYIKTETISGEVEISNNDRYAKNELSIKTTSGDIEVDK